MTILSNLDEHALTNAATAKKGGVPVNLLVMFTSTSLLASEVA